MWMFMNGFDWTQALFKSVDCWDGTFLQPKLFLLNYQNSPTPSHEAFQLVESLI